MASPIEVAAIPTARGIIALLLQLNTNMGPDPLKWALNWPGASAVFLGGVQLLLPGLAVAEGSALQTEVSSKLASWDAELAKIQANP